MENNFYRSEKMDLVSFEWNKIDRSEFAEGEWNEEPDRLCYSYRGLECIILRTPWGTLNGYVEAPESFQNDDGTLPRYMDIDADVHGGLTFGGFAGHLGNSFYYGFDCNHLYDLQPKESKFNYYCNDNTYRNLQYVTENVETLADFLSGSLV